MRRPFRSVGPLEHQGGGIRLPNGLHAGVQLHPGAQRGQRQERLPDSDNCEAGQGGTSQEGVSVHSTTAHLSCIVMFSARPESRGARASDTFLFTASRYKSPTVQISHFLPEIRSITHFLSELQSPLIHLISIRHLMPHSWLQQSGVAHRALGSMEEHGARCGVARPQKPE